MSDAVSRFPKSPDEGENNRRADPDPAPVDRNPGEIPSDDELLDTEHHGRVTRVTACDTARTRKRAAELEIARLVEEEQVLGAELRDLGDDEHVDAIMRSGWFPYTPQIISNARLAWILDAVFWTALWLSLWVFAARVLSHE